MLAIKTDWVPIQVCVLLNIHNLLCIFNVMQMPANIESLDSNWHSKPTKVFLLKKKNKLDI